MKPYDTHATADPFARSISAFETLTSTLSGGSTFLNGLIEPFVGLGRPGVLGVAIRRLPSRGLPRFAARHPTTTRPPIRKCEQVAE